MQLCPNCDNMILPGTTECPYCGAELNAEGGIVGQAHVEAEPQPASSLQETFRNVQLPETEYAEPDQFDPQQFHRIEDLKPLVVTEPYHPTTIAPLHTAATSSAAVDSGGFLWGLLGFFLFPPIGGFIMYMMWRHTYPRRAKAIIMGALLGMLLGGGGLFGGWGGGWYF